MGRCNQGAADKNVIHKHIFRQHVNVEGSMPKRYLGLVAPSLCGFLCGYPGCHRTMVSPGDWRKHHKKYPTHNKIYHWLQRNALKWTNDKEFADQGLEYVTDLDAIAELRKDAMKRSTAMISPTGFIDVTWKEIRDLRAREFNVAVDFVQMKSELEQAKELRLRQWSDSVQRKDGDMEAAEQQRKMNRNVWDSEDEFIDAKDRTIEDVLATRSAHELRCPKWTRANASK